MYLGKRGLQGEEMEPEGHKGPFQLGSEQCCVSWSLGNCLRFLSLIFVPEFYFIING